MGETLTALTGAQVFDGTDIRPSAALLLRGDVVADIVPDTAVPGDARVTCLGGGILAPGFVDLQVNGGGGVMLNDAPSVETLATMARAHARLGATTILPTLITDTAGAMAAAVSAVARAVAAGTPGIGGLHLEGPHLAVARKGAHSAALIRPMEPGDLAFYCQAAQALPLLKLTVAPETVTPAQIAALAGAGALVSLGHSDCSHAQARAAVKAGARMVTHLFNAMSQLGSREPGLVGAALTEGALSAGLIADGIHVHPETMRAALAAKRAPGQICLVSDAMAVAGTALGQFVLNGRTVHRQDGRLTLADGTLAGADLALADAVRRVARLTGDRAQALAMATSIPAGLAGIGGVSGHIAPGRRADLVWLDVDLHLSRVWQGGRAL